MVALIVQEESKKIRTLIVRREEKGSNSGTKERGLCTWIFTCDVRRNGEGKKDSTFWHMNNLHGDSVVSARLKSIVECEFMDDQSLYFGETLKVIETGLKVKF